MIRFLRAEMRQPRWSHCRVLLLFGLAVLLSPHCASGQGLSVGGDVLGAGAAATAVAFEEFEDVLALASTGERGKGRGGRGGSGNLGGFRDDADYAQLQAAYYYISSSPKVYESSNPAHTPSGLNCVPKPSDQKWCSTCVGQAIAAAVQMSLAYTLGAPVENFAVSPLNLYYCSSGGRTCQTAWDIQPALLLLEQNPWLLRPRECFNDVIKKNEAEIGDFANICLDAAANSKDPQCRGITKEQPLYRCSYKSLSSFYQIQQHIRRHGAVITRIAVPDDFNYQFNHSVRTISGLKLPPYVYNASAKVAYGHAAVIVGYDNDNTTWTLLNSWGRGDAKDQTRLEGGVTADGMFRVKMGLLGIGTPDKSYGLSCEPAVGSKLNPYGQQSWLDGKRKGVSMISLEDEECYMYPTAPGDTVSSIADHFDVDIRNFSRANAHLVGTPTELSYKFTNKLKENQITAVLKVAETISAGTGGKKFKPSITCWHYDALGKTFNVTCDSSSQDALNAPCAANGTVGCTLYYQDLVLEGALKPRTKLRLCNERWKVFSEFNKVATIRAEMLDGFAIPANEVSVLFRLREMLLLKSSANNMPSNLSDLHQLNCMDSDQISYISLPDFVYEWSVYCSESTKKATPMVVTRLRIGVVAHLSNGLPQDYLFTLTEEIGTLLLNLQHLELIYMVVFDGQLPPQLAGLRNMRSLSIEHYCLTGELPPGWMPNWKRLEDLAIVPRFASRPTYVDPSGGRCGVRGSIPASWTNTPSDVLVLALSYNNMDGVLPAAISTTWRSIQGLELKGNRFSGSVPSAWAMFPSLVSLNLGDNLLTGMFPASWAALQGKLLYLYLEQNTELKGCLPFREVVADYTGTKISGYCTRDAKNVAAKQAAAMQKYLPGLLQMQYMQDDHYVQAYKRLQDIVSRLGYLLNPTEQTTYFDLANTGVGFGGGMTITVYDGAEYVTGLYFAGAAFDLTILPALVKSLPRLQAFACIECDKMPTSQAPKARVLPSALAQSAPSLQALSLPGCLIDGSLPASWGKWKRLESIDLSYNNLAGTLPTQWKGMSSLKELNVRSNRLSGLLPPQYGLPGTQMRPDLQMFVDGNKNLRGIVPQSYAHFVAGYLSIGGTRVNKSCSPGGIAVDVGRGKLAPECVSTDVQALGKLKELLLSRGGQVTTWDIPNAGSSEPREPPRFCRIWTGITCDNTYRVASLDLTQLETDTPQLDLAQLLSAVGAMTELKALNTSGINVRGTLDPAAPGSGLSALMKLEQLDISNNPSLTGGLPPFVSSLTALSKLVISNTGISGSIPAGYASLQLLQEFRAARCPSLTGELPKEFGMLRKLQVLEITNTQIEGSLPSEWADPVAMTAAGASALAAAKLAADNVDTELRQAQELLALPARVAASSPGHSRKKALGQNLPLSGQMGSSTVTTTGPVNTSAIASLKQLQVQQAGAARAVQALQTAMAGKPSALLGMLNLQQLIIAGNSKLSGSLPAIYSDMLQLKHVDLSANNLEGPLPGQWAAMEQLQFLSVAGNKLTGKLPMLYASLLQLRVLNASDNQFTGPLPEVFVSLRDLAIFDVSNNTLDLTLPAAWWSFAGTGFDMQCMLLSPNAGKRLENNTAGELVRKALNERQPPKEMVVDAVGDRALCDPASLEDVA